MEDSESLLTQDWLESESGEEFGIWDKYTLATDNFFEDFSKIQDYLITSENEVQAVRLSGPNIGPMHTGEIPPPTNLRKNVPKDAVLSPLAITLRGLRKAPRLMNKVSQIVVHQTGRGPVNRSKKSGYQKPAIDFALDYYLEGRGGFAHYVIDFNGTIYATCDERYIAHHAGWGPIGGRKIFERNDWKAPDWWLAVWGEKDFKSPIDLLPDRAISPNSKSIGIEVLSTPTLNLTDYQYQALAHLVIDIGHLEKSTKAVSI